MGCQWTQDLRQLVGTELAPSACAVGKRREANLRHRDLLSPPARSQVCHAGAESRPLPARSGLKVGAQTGNLVVMSDNATWLTLDAYRKTQEEHDHLTTEGRKRIAARLAEARAHGDLRENADYDAAKTEQGLMEARIRKLRHLLDNAVVEGNSDDEAREGPVVYADLPFKIQEESDDGKVREGSIVTLRDADGDIDDYFLASLENQAEGCRRVSPSGPLGQALLGSAEGEDVSYQAPGGTFTFRVLGVRPYEG